MIRVVIFEDNRHMRESMELMLNGTPGFVCVASFSNCDNLVGDLTDNPCDVVLMDIEMPGMNGIEATRLIRQHFPALQVLIQTVFFEDEYIFKAICAGAAGYILKSTTPAAYTEALADVHRGGSPMTPGIARRMVELFRNNLDTGQGKEYGLTEREKVILQHLVSGKSYKMIAAAEFISIDTVKTHIKNLYAKLQVHSAAEAVALAMRERLS